MDSIVNYYVPLSAENNEYELRPGGCVLRQDIYQWCQSFCLTSVRIVAGPGANGESTIMLSFENPRDAAFFKLNFRPETA